MSAHDFKAGTIWAVTNSNILLAHAFGADGRALCNRRIRPREASEDLFSTREAIAKRPMTHAHDRCVKKVAERAEAERLAAASPLAAAVVQLVETIEAADAARPTTRRCSQCDTYNADSDATCICCGSDAGPGSLAPRVVEGTVVEHNGTAQGSRPSDTTHPDVAAAREALRPLLPATVTEHTEITDPGEADPTVRGYLVEPRGNGRIAAYWIESGLITSRKDTWNGTCVKILALAFADAGWTVEPHSMRAVFAWRPDTDTTAQTEAQPAPPAPPARFMSGSRVVCGDGQERHVVGMTHRANEPARVVVAGGAEWIASECTPVLTCLHRVAARPDVSGDPIKECTRSHWAQEAGVFNDEGCVEAYDCAVQAANRAAELNTEEEAPADDPVYAWALMCPEHREQPAGTCQECNTDPEPPIRAGAA
ncbi:hypothetical protein [Streptomyces sp. NPDC051546]|uniref:hypothetical protein n=1 Tax=Streptomyces sp. NPDC051546 TaxID=3365655 RepID=UPI00379ADE0B